MRRFAVNRLAILGLLGALTPAPAAHAQAPCAPGPEALCLLDGRIQVTVDWRNQHAGGVGGTGKAIPQTDKIGAFWFFHEDNHEVIVKALDGTPVNGHLWFFVAALTDVEFWITAEDTVTGARETIYNPPGNRYGIADTAAFDGQGGICGTIVGIGCPPGEFCDLPAGQCDGADLTGVCKPQPTACTAEFVPVCGCDGVTYGNECMRLAAGVQLDHGGSCAGEGAFCGGFAGQLCDHGLACEYQAGTCGQGDAPGTCFVRPTPGTCEDPVPPAPVCGCDGVTYASDCYRRAAGVAKLAEGACR